VKQAAKPQEPYAEALYRLLQKAREERVQLLMDGETERWYATSATMEHVIYAVSETGCTCQGFKSFNRCKHYALFLERFGLRPPTAAELAAAEQEWQRVQSLLSRHQIKSTGDWRHVQTVKSTYERICRIVPQSAFEPAPAA